MDQAGAGASQSLELQANHTKSPAVSRPWRLSSGQRLQASRQVIHKAQALKMDRPLRNLQDL